MVSALLRGALNPHPLEKVRLAGNKHGSSVECTFGQPTEFLVVLILALVLVTLFVAYSNGANDNFKGVATLYGCGAASYRTALVIGTAATFAGCLASVALADALIKAFSGKGLVPNEVSAAPEFLLSVAAGAGLTVILATRFGFPISTTHALTGALAGAGLVMAGSALNLSALGTTFFLPLLISPVLSVLVTMPLYKFASMIRQRLGLNRGSHIGLGAVAPVLPGATGHSNLLRVTPGDGAVTAQMPGATTGKYQGALLGINAQAAVDATHYVSAIAVSFARGLNDTPKIAGLLVAVNLFEIEWLMLAIAAAMALGGWIEARRVAETMSHKISGMNDGQALTANLVTAMLVIGASRLGVPVSTTHVSVGAITGVGIVNGSADFKVIWSILMSWVLTLPIAATAAALTALALGWAT
jgi:inorganic phosphate transporter, PiT family